MARDYCGCFCVYKKFVDVISIASGFMREITFLGTGADFNGNDNLVIKEQTIFDAKLFISQVQFTRLVFVANQFQSNFINHNFNYCNKYNQS